jgi:hypothetical protein
MITVDFLLVLIIMILACPLPTFLEKLSELLKPKGAWMFFSVTSAGKNINLGTVILLLLKNLLDYQTWNAVSKLKFCSNEETSNIHSTYYIS